MGKFSDQVSAFARKARLRNLAIFRASAQRVMEEANRPKAQGGKMPVVTSFLRNSVAASTSGIPAAGGQPPVLLFAGMQLGQTVWVGWTAAYARRMEYGFQGTDSLGRTYNQAGNFFMRSAIQRWPFIVADITKEVKARIP